MSFCEDMSSVGSSLDSNLQAMLASHKRDTDRALKAAAAAAALHITRTPTEGIDKLDRNWNDGQLQTPLSKTLAIGSEADERHKLFQILHEKLNDENRVFEDLEAIHIPQVQSPDSSDDSDLSFTLGVIQSKLGNFPSENHPSETQPGDMSLLFYGENSTGDISADLDADSIDGKIPEEYKSVVTTERGKEPLENLLPSCLKLNHLLSNEGFFPMQLSLSDLQIEHRAISTFIVDSWASSILQAFSELNDRLNTYKAATKESMSSSSYASTEALQYRLSELQSQLHEAEKKDRAQFRRIFELEEIVSEMKKKVKTEEVSTKKLVKGIEQQLQESERKCRQKEVEMDRLREKISSILDKQRASQARQQALLSAHRSPSLDTSTASSMSSPSKKPLSKIATPSKKSPNSSATQTELVKAVEAENENLRQRINDQEKELRVLRRLEGSSLALADTSSTLPPPIEQTQHPSVGTIKSLYEKISSLSTIILELQTKGEVLEGELHLMQNQLSNKENEVAKLSELNQNLTAELESRPSVKQYSHLQRTVTHLEQQVSDLLLHRDNALETAKLRQFMTTKQRVSMDKRDYALGLTYIDMLPQSELAAIVKSLCRDLDLKQVADLQPSIEKLKAVVKAIPFLEKFIKQLCQFLHDNDTLSKTPKVTMEDVFPILTRWRENATRETEFRKLVSKELYRRFVALYGMARQDNKDLDSSIDVVPQDEWQKMHGQDHQIVACIESLVDFDIHMVAPAILNSLDGADEKTSEIAMSRLLANVQELFGVRDLSRLLGCLSEVAREKVRVGAWVQSMKELLGLSRTSDEVIFDEVAKIVRSAARQ